MCKSSVYFIVPPIFGWGPLTLFGLATALMLACDYLVPIVFTQTIGTKKLLIRLVICFLPSTAFAFSCLENNCFLEYLVSENTDCALLFDGFSVLTVIQWLSIFESLASL